VTHDGQLEIWTPGTPGSNPAAALSGVSGTPVWSPDGSQLAAQANGRVVSVRVVAGDPVSLVRLGQAAAPATLVWTPDGHALAFAGPAGVTIAAADGTSAKLVDAHPAAGGVLVWSLAR
jgi:Tol biopolymer transport system component